MIIWIFSFFFVLGLSVCAFLFYSRTMLKEKNRNLDESNRNLHESNKNLNESNIRLNESNIKLNQKMDELEILKIQYIQKIERLQSAVEYKETLITELGKLKDQTSEITKNSVHELGSKLSKELIAIHKQENKESRDLSEKQIKDTYEKFNKQFERVTGIVSELDREVSQSRGTVDLIKNSLLSPSGAGALAEITLENILKSSGLRSHVDYRLQYHMRGDDNNILRPDSIIFLPGNHLMVVDAKASKFLIEEQEDYSKLAKTMNSHLRSLSSKNYADAIKKEINSQEEIKLANIITIMFLPSEHAVEKLAEADKDFLHKAWKANIFPVGPSGLMNMLSFAKFQISEQLMIHNHEMIIEEVKKLISSITTISDHSAKLGNSIMSAANHYDKFAASFNRNFLSKAKRISKMGIENSSKKEQETLPRLQVIKSSIDIEEIEVEVEMRGESKSETEYEFKPKSIAKGDNDKMELILEESSK